jgi:hypothetical protein
MIRAMEDNRPYTVKSLVCFPSGIKRMGEISN